MPWSGEVLGHALILSSPLAACFTARLLARLAAELDTTSRVFSVRSSLARCGTFGLSSTRAVTETRRCNSTSRIGCFQYNNAAFSYQNLEDEDGTDVEDSDKMEEEVDFCILTPQQAFGVLGDHAPQYTKIFVNGSTFVADKSEPGTVLSVDEYANRMQVTSSRNQSGGGSPTAYVSPSDDLEDDSQGDRTSARSTDGGVSISTLSSCGDTFSITSNCSYDRVCCASHPTASQRSSLDLLLVSEACSSRLSNEQLVTLNAVGCVEDPYSCCTVSQTRPDHLRLSVSDAAQADMWRTAAEAVKAASENPSELSAPSTPRELVTPSRPVVSPQSAGVSSASAPPSAQSRRVSLGSRAHGDLQEPCAVARVRLTATPRGGCGLAARSTGDIVRAGSHGGAVAVQEKVVHRRWVPAGSRSMPPPPLPAPVPRSSAPQSRSLTPRSSSSYLQVCNTARTWDVASAPHSPHRQMGRPQTCGGGTTLAGASAGAPGSPGTSPVGLCRAPALPLPDGASLDAEVPPALRYYLAQARAAGNPDSESSSIGGIAAPEDEFSCRSVSMGEVGDDDLAAGRPGFVRATVEQLNTQRLICCHVTPFAAAKTSRKSRPLARVGGSTTVS